MMFVPALMMKPRKSYTGLPALGVVRAFIPLIIFGTAPEFRRAVFAEIVFQPLCIEPEPEAVFTDKMPVSGNGFKVCSRMYDGPSRSFSYTV